MDFIEFSQTTQGNAYPPQNLSEELKALWYDAKNEWDMAHNIIQNNNSKSCARVHAYLHRKKGDLGNASYWYSISGASMPAVSIEEEWESLVGYFLNKP
ncbi:MAG: hypothetical protein ACOC2K_01595 [Bacteroidota bacterium]